MKREKEINIAMKESVTETIYSSGYGFTPQATDLLECAWVKGAEWADETMIDKACEWLDSNFPLQDNVGSWYKEGFIKQFKKVMEE